MQVSACVYVTEIQHLNIKRLIYVDEYIRPVDSSANVHLKIQGTDRVQTKNMAIAVHPDSRLPGPGTWGISHSSARTKRFEWRRIGMISLAKSGAKHRRSHCWSWPQSWRTRGADGPMDLAHEMTISKGEKKKEHMSYVYICYQMYMNMYEHVLVEDKIRWVSVNFQTKPYREKCRIVLG